MCTRRILGLAIVALLTLGGRARAYTNQWAAHIAGGEEMARQVAEDYDFRYLGKVSVTRPVLAYRGGTGLSLLRFLICCMMYARFFFLELFALRQLGRCERWTRSVISAITLARLYRHDCLGVAINPNRIDRNEMKRRP